MASLCVIVIRFGFDHSLYVARRYFHVWMQESEMARDESKLTDANSVSVLKILREWLDMALASAFEKWRQETKSGAAVSVGWKCLLRQETNSGAAVSVGWRCLFPSIVCSFRNCAPRSASWFMLWY